ncbi:hypothetical protein HK101_008571 [Irineochytrium annulatum]|nr:hypothetical protein HK101_008571 [Irineochytrium annulatum]
MKSALPPVPGQRRPLAAALAVIILRPLYHFALITLWAAYTLFCNLSQSLRALSLHSPLLCPLPSTPLVVRAECARILAGDDAASTGGADKVGKKRKGLDHVAAILRPEVVLRSRGQGFVGVRGRDRIKGYGREEKGRGGAIQRREGEEGKFVRLMTTDLAHLVCWCAAAEIAHVSIYDKEGILKRNVQAVIDCLHATVDRFYAQMDPLCPAETAPQLHVFVDNIRVPSSPTKFSAKYDEETSSCSDGGTEDSGVYSNGDEEQLRKRKRACRGHEPEAANGHNANGASGHGSNGVHQDVDPVIAQKTISVYVLDGEGDGKGAMIRAVELLAAENGKGTRLVDGKVARDDINVARVDDLLNPLRIPEPQLLYVFCGPTDALTLEGYPPWQLRLTEMWNVNGDGRIRYMDFLNGLFRFSRCVQRKGK